MKVDDRKKLDELIRRSREIVANMTIKELEEMKDEQKRSFARAMSTPCEHGELDFEQCEKCREMYR